MTAAVDDDTYRQAEVAASTDFNNELVAIFLSIFVVDLCCEQNSTSIRIRETFSKKFLPQSCAIRGYNCKRNFNCNISQLA